MHHIKCLLPLVVVIALGFGEGGASRALAQGTGAFARVDVPVGSTVALQMSEKQFIKSVRSENASVATVAVKVDDPSAVLIKGEKAGFTRVTLIGKDNKAETYEVFVGKSDDQLRQEFLSLARRGVPTAIVDVIHSGATVILTGTVAHAGDIQVIMEIARGLFPGNVAGNAPGGTHVINGMRVGGVQQVQLDVVVATVNRSVARNMGFNFGEFGLNHFIASTVGNTGSTSSFMGSLIAGMAAPAASLASAPATVAMGIVNDKQGFLGFLTALRNENLVKIMAMPSVTTLSGRPAYIIDGGQVPYVATSLQGANVNYLPFGTVVDMLPIVLGGGKIHLEVNPQISEPDPTLSLTVGGTNPVSAPAFKTRSVRSAIRVEDGQTVAIGGLIQTSIAGSTNKLPILGDLPYIGIAFRTVSYTETEEELLVLVTPRLVDPMSCDQLPKLLPGQETRSPDDFELFLEGILEAPRGQRVVGLRHYTAAYHNSPSTQLYPCMNPPGVPVGACPACGAAGSAPVAAPATLPATLPAAVNDLRVAPIGVPAGQEVPLEQTSDTQPLEVPVTTITIPVEGNR